eukprot:scaffold4124_cov378-Prasinococcus_capsulatus_cf.AAC.1
MGGRLIASRIFHVSPVQRGRAARRPRPPAPPPPGAPRALSPDLGPSGPPAGGLRPLRGARPSGARSQDGGQRMRRQTRSHRNPSDQA